MLRFGGLKQDRKVFWNCFPIWPMVGLCWRWSFSVWRELDKGLQSRQKTEGSEICLCWFGTLGAATIAPLSIYKHKNLRHFVSLTGTWPCNSFLLVSLNFFPRRKSTTRSRKQNIIVARQQYCTVISIRAWLFFSLPTRILQTIQQEKIKQSFNRQSMF